MTATDDRLLVRAVARDGDERAFGALYERHTPALYGLALRLAGGNAPDAQDLVHDAWVRAAEGFAGFRWHSSLRTWLSGIVVNCARELWRTQGRAEPLLDTIEPGSDDREIAGTFDRLELERALASLATGYREVLLLHDVEGFSHEEIGALLSVSPGTSKSQLSRARQAMRRALGPSRKEA